MTGAMYAAISGLKTHMNKLNVIGNNVANVNTYGFKSGRTTFQEALYTTSRSGSNGTDTIAGRNPVQIGYGTELRSIDLKMSTGNYAPTGVSSDCMIDGDGFFLVGDKDVTIDPTNPEDLKKLTLTRVGDFVISNDGYLTDRAGNIVYGFMCTQTTGDDGTTINAQPYLVPLQVPLADANGKAIYPTFPNGQLTYPPSNGGTADADEEDTRKRINYGALSIDGETGKITCTNRDDDNAPVTIGYIALGVPDNSAGVSHVSGPYYTAGEGAGDLRIASIGGSVSGYINNPDIEDGAEEANPAMRIGSAGDTELVTGGLELSNADLATEITEMITTQRGYQANTRIVTVTDTMLEELVNMKR